MADLTDDEVRAAWRRIAAATHPDLPDGGDPPRFAAAAAAYATLRTAFGRGEARADLTGPSTPAPHRFARRSLAARAAARAAGLAAGLAASRAPRSLAATSAARHLAGRLWSGRPMRLLMRVGLAAGVSLGCAAVAGWQPATLAVAVGCLTWLIRTTRYDLGPHACN